VAQRPSVTGCLFLLARSAAGRWLAGFVFGHMSFLLPVKRLRETERLVAFYHPRPAYPVHILIVPKKGIAELTALTTADGPFLLELVEAVRELVIELALDGPGYRLIANGGGYQDIPQLHFHLVSGGNDHSTQVGL
jgi:histidine triad (HIT) family protein